MAHAPLQLSSASYSDVFILLVGSLPVLYVLYQGALRFGLAKPLSAPVPVKKHSAAGEGDGIDGRKWGKWVPVDWKYPEVEPWTDFDLKKTPPLPYRGFRYQHLTTMGIRNMPWSEWFELDNLFPVYHSTRAKRVAERGERVCRTLPPARDAVRELCLAVAEFQAARYPQVFNITRRGPNEQWWFGPNEIRSIALPELGVTYDLDKEDPLYVAGMLVQDDMAIMMEGEDSLYYMQAGFIALAGSWRLEDKIGRDLRYIHTSGEVPEYMSKLDLSMTRFHQRIRPDKAVLRNNYTFVQCNELAWATFTKGPEDHFDQLLKGPNKNSLVGKTFEPPKPTTNPQRDIYIRQERQGLRRLPITGGVIFTVHSYLDPVASMIEEPGVPGRLASTLRSWKGDVYKHKNGELYHAVLLPWLDAEHAKQVAAGVTPEDKGPFNYPY